MAALKFKPKSQQVRLVFGDGRYLSGMDHVSKNPRKIFAVIGPFEHHTDKPELQDVLEVLCRGYNVEPS